MSARGKFQSEWAGALADVKAAGAAVVWTKTQAGTIDEITEQAGAPSSTTVTGYAMRTGGDPQQYIDAGLRMTDAPSLFFVADVYGDVPTPGATVVFGGVTYTERSSRAFAPDGVAIFTDVLVSI